MRLRRRWFVVVIIAPPGPHRLFHRRAAQKNTQRYFRGHNDDIICLAQSPKDPDMLATGQVASIVNKKATPPTICVWNSRTLETWEIKNAGQRAVRSVAFNMDGTLLASVAADNENSVTVWDLRTKTKVATEKGDTNKICQVRWSNLV